ncbi:hypothetical protein [Mesorhizobium sp.]|uniref:hypothetical protein n=1 Tax=Mesorhizobium sp. TaxID=1871066 RepID=UPI00257C5893|nr:hypothetical protein [Mesorhizobium sp.]
MVLACALIDAQVLAAEWLHGDDPTASMVAKGKTTKDQGRIWLCIRDDRSKRE